MNRLPKLALPLVDVEVLPECGRGGVGRGSSSASWDIEPIVEDLPRLLRRIGGRAGDDLADRAEAVDSARRGGGNSGPAKFIDVAASAVCDGDGKGDGSPCSKKGRRIAVTGGV